MTLKGTLIADFSSFYAAVEKAKLSLSSFEGGANKVEKSLNRMGDSLTGRKLIQEASLMVAAVDKIGGVSKLTGANLDRVTRTAAEAAEQLRAIGEKVPPKMQALADQVKPLPSTFDSVKSAVTAVGGALGIAFTGSAIINGIKNQIAAAVNYADTLTNLSVSTGVSVKGLQQLEAVGVTSGVSLDTLARAVNTLHRNLDDKDAQKALKEMGLDFAAISRLPIHEKFVAIAQAIQKIEDPVKRANAGAALFNRTWDTIAPAINKDIGTIIKQTKTLSDSQVSALDEAGDEWDRFFLNVSKGTKGFIADILAGDRAMDEAGWLGRGKKPEPIEFPTVKNPTRIGLGAFVNDVDPEMISNLQVYGKTLEETVKATEKAAEATRKAADARAKFLEMSKAGLGSEFDWQRQVDLTKWSMTQLRVEETALYDQTRTLADFVAEHRGDMFPEPPQGSLDKWKEGQGLVKEMPPHISTLRDDLAQLGESFSRLGNIGGDSLSKLTRGIGSLINGSVLAVDSVKMLKDGFSSLGAGSTLKGIASIASGIGGIVTIANTAISAVKSLWNWAKGGEEGTVVNPARDEWFRGRSVDDIGDQLAAVGVDRETARQMVQSVFNAKTKSAFDSATGAIDALLRGQGLSFAQGTRGKYLDFGSGTLAMLHGKEKITPMGSESSTDRPIHIHVNMDGREVAWALVPHIPDAQAALA